MHLLNKSKFYSSYIFTKIEKSIETEKAVTKKKENTMNKENKAPSKNKYKKPNLEKCDIRKYIPADVSNNKILILIICNKIKGTNLSLISFYFYIIYSYRSKPNLRRN